MGSTGPTAVRKPNCEGPTVLTLFTLCNFQLDITIWPALPSTPHTDTVVMDALFGFSFRGPPRGPLAAVLQELVALSATVPVFSVDIPSGWYYPERIVLGGATLHVGGWVGGCGWMWGGCTRRAHHSLTPAESLPLSVTPI